MLIRWNCFVCFCSFRFSLCKHNCVDGIKKMIIIIIMTNCLKPIASCVHVHFIGLSTFFSCTSTHLLNQWFPTVSVHYPACHGRTHGEPFSQTHYSLIQFCNSFVFCTCSYPFQAGAGLGKKWSTPWTGCQSITGLTLNRPTSPPVWSRTIVIKDTSSSEGVAQHSGSKL